jgi:hypothetical protein
MAAAAAAAAASNAALAANAVGASIQALINEAQVKMEISKMKDEKDYHS